MYACTRCYTMKYGCSLRWFGEVILFGVIYCYVVKVDLSRVVIVSIVRVLLHVSRRTVGFWSAERMSSADWFAELMVYLYN